MNVLQLNKSTAFTLAEVLITLSIIGIVASLTIPSLIQNIQDAQFKTAWKKTYADISQATMRIRTDNGGDFKGSFTDTGNLVEKYSNYLNIAKKHKTYAAGFCGNTWSKSIIYSDNSSNECDYGIGMVLGSGVVIAMNTLFNSDCSQSALLVKPDLVWEAHQNIFCGSMIVDVNGMKEPNKVGKDIFGLAILPNRIIPYSPSVSSDFASDSRFKDYPNSSYYLSN